MMVESVMLSSVWSQPTAGGLRSANVVADTLVTDGIAQYWFTERSTRFLSDVLDSMEARTRDRAWSVIGPYGSGKSLFAVFLNAISDEADLSPWAKQVLDGLSVIDPVLAERVTAMRARGDLKFIRIPVVGSKSRLEIGLTRGLLAACRGRFGDDRWVSAAFADKVDRHLQILETGVSDAEATSELFSEAAQLAKSAGTQGLIIVVDEFGLYLEHAAERAEPGNLDLAQRLAEQAVRSDRTQLHILTLVHQVFAQYGAGLSRDDLTYWEKVQGRFREVSFVESPENQYHLITSFLGQAEPSDRHMTSIHRWADRIKTQTANLPVFSGAAGNGSLVQALERFYPIHPLALYALPRLAAAVGQNERSLFAFLSSSDPTGFQSFIHDTEWSGHKPPSISLDYLYDYFFGMRASLAVSPIIRRRLSEAEAALDRCDTRAERRLVKVITLLSILERGTSVRPTLEYINAAIDTSSNAAKKELDTALRQLVEDRVLLFREYSGEYKVWQGSDFDFEASFAAIRADSRLTEEGLTSVLDSLAPRPIVARRHGYETGTTRAVDIRFASVARVRQDGIDFVRESTLHDGAILFVVPDTQSDLKWAQEWVSTDPGLDLIICVPRETLRLRRLVQDLDSARRLLSEQSVGEDPIAVREIASRIDYLEARLRNELDFASSDVASDVAWHWGGEEWKIESPYDAYALVSDLCDQLYGDAPLVRNEMVNRERLSTSAVIAAKRFIDALLNEPNSQDLGLEGNGPEVSIAHALIEYPGLWKRRSGKWGLGIPPRDDPARFKPVMRLIQNHVESAERTAEPDKSPFPVMLDDMSTPPYGVHRGLGMVLVWVYLIQHRSQLALYDNGTYVTEWTVELYDRFTKHPEFFSVQWFGRPRSLQTALRGFVDAIPDAPKTSSSNLSFAEVLRPLYAWYRRLPEYTKRTTKVSERAIALRRTLASAIDPVQLVQTSIPHALRAGQNEARSQKPANLADSVVPFKETVEELDRCYAVLVNRIVDHLASETHMGVTLGEIRAALLDIGEAIIDRIKDPQSKAFFMRAQGSTLDDHAWVQSVASGLVSQAPQYWSDVHTDEFEERLSIAMAALRDAQNRSFYAPGSTDYRIRLMARFPSGRIRSEELGPADVDHPSDQVTEEIINLLADAGIQDNRSQLQALGKVVGKLMTPEPMDLQKEDVDD
jgi:hypothetical protein